MQINKRDSTWMSAWPNHLSLLASNHHVGLGHIYLHSSFRHRLSPSKKFCSASSLVSAVSTKSFAWSSSQISSPLHSFVASSITGMNRRGLRAEAWSFKCIPKFLSWFSSSFHQRCIFFYVDAFFLVVGFNLLRYKTITHPIRYQLQHVNWEY